MHQAVVELLEFVGRQKVRILSERAQAERIARYISKTTVLQEQSFGIILFGFCRVRVKGQFGEGCKVISQLLSTKGISPLHPGPSPSSLC